MKFNIWKRSAQCRFRLSWALGARLGSVVCLCVTYAAWGKKLRFIFVYMVQTKNIHDMFSVLFKIFTHITSPKREAKWYDTSITLSVEYDILFSSLLESYIFFLPTKCHVNKLNHRSHCMPSNFLIRVLIFTLHCICFLMIRLKLFKLFTWNVLRYSFKGTV